MSWIILITLTFISLVTSSPASLDAGLSLENIESHIDDLWASFKKGYDVVYNSTLEETHRFRIFTKNVKMIIQHNIEHDLGLHTYRLGINKYAILVI